MRRVGRFALIVFEIALLTALIAVTRCANYQDVFVGGNVYFVDADCYARMTRAQMVVQKPGLIIRHHAFENFPQGATPHTTAPLDYMIVGLSFLLNPFTGHALDLAGAFVSPLLALLGGWFLWWWSRRMEFRYRWTMLILYAISPILVHGTQLGRPDHQSLLIILVAMAICADWSSQTLQSASDTKMWWLTSAVAWALAIWVSAYEPVVLFLIVTAMACLSNLPAVFARDRRAGWFLFAGIIAIAFAVERRVPSFPVIQSNGHFKEWASTIGELAHVSPLNSVWLNWCGYLLLITPILIWMSVRMPTNGALSARRTVFGRAAPIYVLLIATYFLTVWQARWGYFFVLIFALALPALLAPIRSSAAVWIAFVLSLFPILRDWDEGLWPNEEQLGRRIEKRIESAQVRDLALILQSNEMHPFLAPWWLSPSIAYWSGQPGVTGSSHESLKGIDESARFFLSENLQEEREILEKRHVAWVFAYDSDRVAQNSGAVLNEPVPLQTLCRLLD
ncbi:MAG TPA: hypothetical protein VL912_09770, partial [Candidatus Udaeobacter sp.]|nr:hypothetical protein [Candidatus Udaeobacter sp.]